MKLTTLAQDERLRTQLASVLDLSGAAGRAAAPVVDLLVRLALAKAFFALGMFPGIGAADFPAAWQTIIVQVIGPVLMAIGLLVRPVALLMLVLRLIFLLSRARTRVRVKKSQRISNPFALIVIQLLDVITGAVLGVMTAVIIADVTNGTGRFNLAQGMFGTVMGVGASLSPTLTGLIVDQFGRSLGFLSLAGEGLVALVVLAVFLPETKEESPNQTWSGRTLHKVQRFRQRPPTVCAEQFLGIHGDLRHVKSLTMSARFSVVAHPSLEYRLEGNGGGLRQPVRGSR